MIGYFANTLVQRARLAEEGSFSRLLAEVREMALDAYTHGDLPFELLVEELRPERHLSHNPIFQVFFVLHGGAPPSGATVSPAGLPGAQVELLPLVSRTSLLDLALAVHERGEALDAFFEYKTDLFDPPTVGRMAGHLATFLAAAVASPDLPLAALPILSAAERHQLVEGWNDTAAEVPAGTTAHRLFERRAAAAPGAIAVEHAGETLTYGELNARANRLAHRLRRRGIGPGALVGICLERGPAMVAALLAVLKSGGAYVPLDPTYPADRLAFLAEDSGLRLLLTERAVRGALPPLDAEALELDGEPDESENDPVDAADPAPLAGPLDLAYVLYTSGSTGKPKGVEVRHRGLANFLLSMARMPGLRADDRLVAVTTIAFDIAALELFLPLAAGARIVLASRAEAADGRRLAALLAGPTAITAMQATPATWRLLLASGWRGDPRLVALCGGEALPGELARELLPRVAALWNLYGPTETTIWSAVERVASSVSSSSSSATVPIGRPIANTALHLVDRRLEPVPVGVAGELLIGGAGLARGYRRRPDLTAASFVPDPLGAPGARLYRTGDLARRLAGGEIEFLGRADHQVKVRGYRIELGEIEAALGAHPAVEQAVVAVREVGEGSARSAQSSQLVAYVVLRPSAAHGASVGNLRAALREELPEPMVPSLFVVLPELPLTPNGKVDRRALPAPGTGQTAGSSAGPAGRQPVAPRTPVEEQVAAVWREVLGLPAVSVDDNFFELGGHSLMATQVVSRLEAAYGVDLGLPAIFKAPTVAGLSEAIVARGLAEADDALLAELLVGLEG
jgi:amino acid adenylation domain-containing protein